jgi:predicted nucleic acid-binding protein
MKFQKFQSFPKWKVLSFVTEDEHYQLLSSFILDSIVFDLREEIVNTTIDLRRKHKIKLPDAIIAATALVYNLILISRNTTDFNNIKNLAVIDPHNL